MKPWTRGILTLAGLPALALAADAGRTDDAQLRSEMQSALERLADTGALGRLEADQGTAMYLPATRTVSLGIVLDASAAAGPTVLAVSPDDNGQRLGIAVGDVLLALNGSAVARGADASAQLRSLLEALPDNAPLAVKVRRNGQELALSGHLFARHLPALRVTLGGDTAMAANGTSTATGAVAATAATSAAGEAGCGRISVFHIAPRSKHLYPAKVLSLDGHIPGPSSQETWRVPAGPHTLRVAEDIDSYDLPVVYDHDRRDKEKTLLIDVRPGVTYMVSSRLNVELRDKIRDGRYWDPVVSKEIPEACP